MAFATSIRGSYRCERTTAVVPCARRKSLAATVASLLAAAPALADAPSLEGLSSYDAFTSSASSASAKVASAASQASSIDLSGLQDAGPLVAGLATGVVLVGGALAYVTNSSGGPKIQGLQAAKALSLLEDDPAALLLDIRPKDSLKEDGAPDLRSAKKSSISLPYKPATGDASSEGTVVVGWAERVAKMKKINEETVLVLLDVDGTQSAAAARDLTRALPEIAAVNYVAGGSAAWLAQELPWREPLKLGLNFDSLKSLDLTGVSAGTEKLVEKYKENPTLVNGAVAATAVAGASVFLFTEIEAILQVVGIVFALQFLARKLLFAQDRQQLLMDLKTLINEKIGAGDAGEDLRRLASAVLDAEAPEDIANAAKSAASSADEAVPENVASARKWINAWREKQKTTVMA